MKLSLKKIKDWFIKYKLVIFDCIFSVILCIVWFSLGYYINEIKQPNDNDNASLSNESAVLISLEYGATTEDNVFNYVVLNPITMNYFDGTTNYQYRSCGSLFIGYNRYNNDNIYLYYPSYINNVIEYRSILLTGNLDTIVIACNQTNTTFHPVNFTCLVSWYGYDSGINAIEDIDYYSYQSSMVDITTINSQYNGFTNESLFLFNDIDILQIYNTTTLSSALYSYSDNIQYIPAVHFTDTDTYNLAYYEGAEAGYNSGYELGYNYGVTQTLEDLTPMDVLTTNFNGLMKLDIFPGFTIGNALWLAVGIVLFGALMKVFRF